MQVGKESLPLLHERILDWERLFYLQNQIGLLPDLVRGRRDTRTGSSIFRVRETSAETG